MYHPPHPHHPSSSRYYCLLFLFFLFLSLGIWYREWAPGAKALALVGEFNNWEPRPQDWAIKNDFGVWNLFLPDNPDGTSAIPHRSVCGCVWGGGSIINVFFRGGGGLGVGRGH
jgi:hypothetical protein